MRPACRLGRALPRVVDPGAAVALPGRVWRGLSSLLAGVARLSSAPEMYRSLWLYTVFFASGTAALVYPLVWQRVLFAIYGIDIESVTVVVTVFMLGLGIGSLMKRQPVVASALQNPKVEFVFDDGRHFLNRDERRLTWDARVDPGPLHTKAGHHRRQYGYRVLGLGHLSLSGRSQSRCSKRTAR